MADILDAIDRSIGCLHCGKSLKDSPSPSFCSDLCQSRYAAEKAQEALGASRVSVSTWTVEDAPEGPFPWLPVPTWRLPRSTGDLESDDRRARYAFQIATTKWQRDACKVRQEDIARRRAEERRNPKPKVMSPGPVTATTQAQAMADALLQGMQGWATAMSVAFGVPLSVEPPEQAAA